MVRVFALAVASACAACITVNVNFPESAVKQAADDFVRDLYKDSATASAETAVDSARVPTSDEQSGESEKPAKKKKNAKPPAAKANPNEQTFFKLFRALDPVPAAHAEELNMSSSKAKAIKGRMSARLGDILKWKAKGAVGESYDGNLVPRDAGALGKDEKKQVEALVEKENSDRAELYDEIQSVNAISDRKQTRIRKLFGNAFRSNSPAGTWVQTEDGSWNRK